VDRRPAGRAHVDNRLVRLLFPIPSVVMAMLGTVKQEFSLLILNISAGVGTAQRPQKLVSATKITAKIPLSVGLLQ